MKTVEQIVADRDDREMMLRPDAWPNMILTIKHKNYSIMDGPNKGMGVIIPAANELAEKSMYEQCMVFVILDCNMFEVQNKTVADVKKMHVDELIAAGWVVD